MTLIKVLIKWKDQVKFDQVKKKSFDQTANLTENFDQLKRSSEIWSTEPLSLQLIQGQISKFQKKSLLLHNKFWLV